MVALLVFQWTIKERIDSNTMGLLSRAVSITRYRVEGKLRKPILETVARCLKEHAISEIDGDVSDKIVGWTLFDRPFEPDFNGSSYVIGTYFVFSLRIDKRTIPAKLLKKHCAIETAKRLDETSQVVHGLKEFCDQLPDAVLLTDRDGRIFSWNMAAENLYGRNWDQMHHQSIEDIYEDPHAYGDFRDDVGTRYSVREKILTIRHPQKGIRFVSTSTTLLYDGHKNLQGVLSLARDVTDVKNLEKKYRRARHWLFPSFILLALFVTAAFFGYPYFAKGYRSTDVKKQELRNQLSKDCFFLRSLLTDAFLAGNRLKTSQLMKQFFDIQDTSTVPYTGLVLLDEDKEVFDAYSIIVAGDASAMVGSSYALVDFEGSERSLHKVLTLYRKDKDHPMGYKGIEIAFEVKKDNQSLGWLIFQLDTDVLGKEYGLDEEGLKKFQFKAP